MRNSLGLAREKILPFCKVFSGHPNILWGGKGCMNVKKKGKVTLWTQCKFSEVTKRHNTSQGKRSTPDKLHRNCCSQFFHCLHLQSINSFVLFFSVSLLHTEDVNLVSLKTFFPFFKMCISNHRNPRGEFWICQVACGQINSGNKKLQLIFKNWKGTFK